VQDVFLVKNSHAAKSVHTAYKTYTSPRSRADDYCFNVWVQKCVRNDSEVKNNENSNIFQLHLQNL